LLVGGPDFFDKVMEGEALAVPERSKHARNKAIEKGVGRENSRGSNIFPLRSSRKRSVLETCCQFSLAVVGLSMCKELQTRDAVARRKMAERGEGEEGGSDSRRPLGAIVTSLLEPP